MVALVSLLPETSVEPSPEPDLLSLYITLLVVSELEELSNNNYHSILRLSVLESLFFIQFNQNYLLKKGVLTYLCIPKNK
mgnify:CR=1 FL=1